MIAALKLLPGKRTALLAAMRVLTDPAETGAVTVSLPEDVQSEVFDWPERFLERGRSLRGAQRGALGKALWKELIDSCGEAAAKQFADVLRFRSVLRQQIVEQDNITRHLRDLSALRVVGALRRGDQQAEDKRGYRPDEARAQPDHILVIWAQVMPGKEHTEQGAARARSESVR